MKKKKSKFYSFGVLLFLNSLSPLKKLTIRANHVRVCRIAPIFSTKTQQKDVIDCQQEKNNYLEKLIYNPTLIPEPNEREREKKKKKDFLDCAVQNNKNRYICSGVYF